MNNISEIKRILTLSEIAERKVELDFRGRVMNPKQQSAAKRLYRRAYNLAKGLDMNQFLLIHREVISSLTK